MNAVPLCRTLDCAVHDHPPRLKKMLEAGELDAALLSSIEYLRKPAEYDYVRGVGIVSNGKAESVRLYLLKPIKQVRRVGLDPHSFTANALARLLLRRLYRIDPFVGQRYDSEWSHFDAAVVIGDESFQFSKTRFLDLGKEWQKLTDLPFVYALWIFRADHPRRKEIEAAVLQAARDGVKGLAEAAPAAAAQRGLDPARVKRYWTSILRYQVGKKEEEGLRKFEALLREEELL